MFARIREKLIAFRQKTALSNKRIAALFIVLLIVIALPLMVIVSQQEQDIRQRASELVSPPLPPPAPIFGKSVKFNNDISNNAYATISATTLAQGNPFTVEAWVKMPKPSSGNGIRVYSIVHYSNPPIPFIASGYIFRLGTEIRETSGTSRPAFKALLDEWSDASNGHLAYITAGQGVGGDTTLQPDQWHHIATTSQSNGKECLLKMYVDGILIASTERLGPNGGDCQISKYSPQQLLIAKPVSGAGGISGYYYNGEIDELRISNIVRYTGNFTPSNSPFSSDVNTLALWHFDGDINDATGNGNNGTVTGDAQFVDSTITGIIPSPSPTPIPSPTPTPTLSPLPISLKTDQVSLQADNFFIKIDDKIFRPGANFELHSDPGKPTFDTNTLELRWFEDKTEMRLFIYFSIDSNNQWKVTEMRTYDGKTPGNWLYYLGAESGKLGTPFANSNYSKLSKGGKGYINFGQIKMQPFLNLLVTPTPTPKPSITVISPNGGEKWEIGKTYNVTWNYSGPKDCTVSVVLVNYSNKKTYGGNSLPISASLKKYSFTIPTSIPLGENIYKIAVTGGKMCGIVDQSDKYLSVVAAPTPTPIACTVCAADVNGSGTVDQFDLQIVNRCFG